MTLTATEPSTLLVEPTPLDVALDVREVTVSYGALRAVDHVSFAVPAGSIVGLIGPNGAGKTTVFDAICGLTPTTRGRVVLGGRDITDFSPAARARAGLGRSFQDARLFPSLSVTEALACALERHVAMQDPVSTALRMPWISRSERRIARRVDELIELMGVGAFRDKFISELSTGSRRIVDLACVLAHDPSVVLLDEPSSGIAQKETEALAPLLLGVKRATGCTMLLIEHDMPLVTSVSDELIALEVGQVIARGTPKEVTTDLRVVEAYLGTDERIIARSGTAQAAPAKPRRARPPRARSRRPAAAVRGEAAASITSSKTDKSTTKKPTTSRAKTAAKAAKTSRA